MGNTKAGSIYPLNHDKGVQRTHIEVRFIRNGKIIEKRKIKVRRFDALKIYKAIRTLVECTGKVGSI